jgi:hypothetical protein
MSQKKERIKVRAKPNQDSIEVETPDGRKETVEEVYVAGVRVRLLGDSSSVTLECDEWQIENSYPEYYDEQYKSLLVEAPTWYGPSDKYVRKLRENGVLSHVLRRHESGTREGGTE